MIVEHYRGSVTGLCAALCSAEVLGAYLAQLETEPADVAEPSLLKHLRAMQRGAQQVLTGGIDLLHQSDPVLADQLLTDIFAIATWNGWPLPVERRADIDATPAHGPSGLLGSGDQGQGAAIWVDGDDVLLARNRTAGSEADLTHHWKA